ncbi:MAG: hypothetical protein RIC19_25205 [Phaeodactylibacter sp.]|uniref:hypothetical protein n=1 Tax=Phaeodactylibacter sp. TaxID=1940289 RepID=UPI0032ECF5E6
MMKVYISLAIMACCSVVLYSGCTSDKLPEPMIAGTCTDTIPAYDPQIRQIIEETCAYSGCHLDGTAPGVYDSYQGLLPNIESGALRTRVLQLKDDPNQGMPPDYAPEGRPKDLTQEQLDLIECWLDSGYPE